MADDHCDGRALGADTLHIASHIGAHIGGLYRAKADENWGSLRLLMVGGVAVEVQNRERKFDV
jgi:hypothetical protein